MQRCHGKIIKDKERAESFQELPPIKGFQEVTLIDWDGKVASIIFLGGCNFRCGFCHSKALVEDFDSIDTIPFYKIDEFLKQKTGWIDGVVITGGEPTLYGSKLNNLIQLLIDRGFPVKLDTNGTNPALLKKLIDFGFLDYIAMDIKAPLRQETYRSITGVDTDIEAIMMSKDIIIGSNIDYEFRTTIIPGIISVTVIEEIAKLLIPAKKYRLQQFQPKDTLDPSFLKLRPYSEKDLKEMAETAQRYIPDTKFRK